MTDKYDRFQQQEFFHLKALYLHAHATVRKLCQNHKKNPDKGYYRDYLVFLAHKYPIHGLILLGMNGKQSLTLHSALPPLHHHNLDQCQY